MNRCPTSPSVPCSGPAPRTPATTRSACDLVAAAAREARGIPIVAIGGITLETAASVIDAGAASVAVISDLLATGDPRDRIGAYLQMFSRYRV